MISLLRYITIIILALSLGGCLSTELKKIEIRQLETELKEVRQTRDYLKTGPMLSKDYDGEVFLSGNTFNAFLSGIENYEIVMRQPEGARLLFKTARLDFRDGIAGILVDAHARDKSDQIEIAMRLRADLLIDVDPETSALRIRPMVKEILPDVRLSIFRWQEFWFAFGLWLRVEAQDYLDSVPSSSFPLNSVIELTTDTQNVSVVRTDGGYIRIKQEVPQWQVAYKSRVIRPVVLQDGVHVLFGLEKTPP